MGEGRYRPLLCLVQIAVEAGGEVRVEVLDPLDGRLDPAPLAEVLADPDIEIVLHAGRQDVALLRASGRPTSRNVFDTQVAAGFAGLRAQLGYEALLHEVLGIRLRKTASFTRWDARPLTDEQVDYARDDVQHLLPLADALQDRLDEPRPARLGARGVPRAREATDERDPDDGLRRLPRVNSLDPRERAVARELVAWREEHRARAGPAGRRRVLRDAALVELAKRQPGRSSAARADPRHQRADACAAAARAILEAVERGRERAADPARGERPPPTEPSTRPLIALAEALVRARALGGGARLRADRRARRPAARSSRAARDGSPEPDVAHAAGLAPRARRRRAARAARRPPLADGRPRPHDRRQPLTLPAGTGRAAGGVGGS